MTTATPLERARRLQLEAALDELELATGGNRDEPDHCTTCAALALLARLVEKVGS